MSQSKGRARTAQLNVWIEPELREEFIAATKRNDSNAAREVRGFVRSYVDAHRDRAAA